MSTTRNPYKSTTREDVTQVRQPCPAPRRQGTRAAVIAAARQEG